MIILVINPGSTSTKLSLYKDKQEIITSSYFHDAPTLLHFKHVNDQIDFRLSYINKFLTDNNYTINDIDVIAARGGSAYSQKGGVISIDDRLYQDTLNGVGGSEHAAKLGVLLAYKLTKDNNIVAYTMDATNVDELCDYARLTGIKGVYRNAQSHVLNQKAVAKYYASSINKEYEQCNLIVAHIDGGITVGAHNHGQLIDCNVGSGGDGSFTPTRIGSVPVLTLLDYIEKTSIDNVRLMCSRSGGFVSYFNTSNADTIYNMVLNNDPKAKLIWNSMIYNIAKQIGEMSAVLHGDVDAIILTGGFIRFNDIVEQLKQYCGFIAPIVTVSDREQETLALNAYLAYNKEIEVHAYTGKPVFNGFDYLD